MSSLSEAGEVAAAYWACKLLAEVERDGVNRETIRAKRLPGPGVIGAAEGPTCMAGEATAAIKANHSKSLLFFRRNVFQEVM